MESASVLQVYRYVAEGAVIYVGMGKPNRPFHHLKACFWARRSPFYNKLRKLLQSDVEVGVEVLWETECRKEAADKEKEFISLYRLRSEGGSLWNLARGGEGCALSGEPLKKRNAAIKDALINSPAVAARRKPPKPRKPPYSPTPEERKRLSERMLTNNPMKSASVVEKMRQSKIGVRPGAETRAKMSAAHKGRKHSSVTCPHCGKTGGATAMPRWHFDNCKELQK